ncbi:hypothetical protein M405DRAFT_814308 [Rhizopogon salebrosus TDB-379]|nr:hypothetical protein M405DRAFT_814308 [Rhizopogon salebrosus TDB-379]
MVLSIFLRFVVLICSRGCLLLDALLYGVYGAHAPTTWLFSLRAARGIVDSICSYAVHLGDIAGAWDRYHGCGVLQSSRSLSWLESTGPWGANRMWVQASKMGEIGGGHHCLLLCKIATE